MTDLYNAKLLDLIPPNLKTDPDMIAASQMEDNSFQRLLAMTNKVKILADIDSLEDDALDHLAWGFNADFYDGTLTVEKKRNLIKNVIKSHMKKGTAGAVEDILSVVFDVSTIEEWFTYDGDPYHFKIKTMDVVDSDKYQGFKTVINSVKNARSHLESFVIERQKEIPTNLLVGIHKVRKIEIPG